MVSEIEKAYAAGLVDGEGCISIRRHKNLYYMSVTLTSSTPVLIQFLKDRWQGNVRAYAPGEQSKLSKKTTYLWSVAAKMGGNFLKDILPYLTLKKEQAILALEFQEHMSSANYRRVPQDVLSLREAYWTRLKAMHH